AASGEDGGQEVRPPHPEARDLQGNEDQVAAAALPDAKNPPSRRVFSFWAARTIAGPAPEAEPDPFIEVMPSAASAATSRTRRTPRGIGCRSPRRTRTTP